MDGYTPLFCELDGIANYLGTQHQNCGLALLTRRKSDATYVLDNLSVPEGIAYPPFGQRSVLSLGRHALTLNRFRDILIKVNLKVDGRAERRLLTADNRGDDARDPNNVGVDGEAA